MHKLFKSIKEEHERPVEGIIKGDIPSWITGSLYRNGHGLYEVGETKYNHLFDPMAMLQRFHIENKQVTYQNRFLQSEVYKKNIAANRIVVGAVGTAAFPDPCKTIFQRCLSYFEPEVNDNTFVSLFPLKDELYATTETRYINRIDPETLDVIERVDLADHVAVRWASAHPHYDADGTIHNMGVCFQGIRPKICIIKIPPKEEKYRDFPKGKVISAMPSNACMKINYLHTFGITENYYVYVEQPILISMIKALTAHLRGMPMATAIEWCPSTKARFRIIDKGTGEEVNPEIVYEGDPLVVFHHINAYEDDGHVVVDLCGYKDSKFLEYLYLKNLTSERCEEGWRKCEHAEPRRYVLPLRVDKMAPPSENQVKLTGSEAKAELRAKGTVHCTHERIADTNIELPQINYSHRNGKKYRYIYGLDFNSDGPHFYTVVKIDVDTKSVTEWGENDCYPSEPVFVPHPNCTAEDDGVVLTAVNDTKFESGKSAFLLVLDAKTMKEIARAEFKGVKRFPRDAHGLFRAPPQE